jgi:hypothetical protein
MKRIILVTLLLILAGASGVEAQLFIDRIAGQVGVPGYAGDGGPAVDALLNTPYSIIGDKTGNVYISAVGDNGATALRKIDVNGKISTIIGNKTQTVDGGDGLPASQANVGNVSWLCTDGSNNLYFVDNRFGFVPTHPNVTALRKIDASTGIISSICTSAGTQPFAAGIAAKDAIFQDGYVIADAAGNLYVVLSSQQQIIYKINTGGMISVYMDLTGATNSDGSALNIISNMRDMAMDPSGNFYFTNENECTVYKASLPHTFSLYAGIPNANAFGGDGGPALQASFFVTPSVTTDASGNVYVMDLANSRIRKIDASTGNVSTIAGSDNPDYAYYGDGGPALQAGFGLGDGILRIDKDGSYLWSDNSDYVVRKIYYPVAAYSFDAVSAKTYGDPDFTLSASVNIGAIPTFTSDKPAILSVTSDGHAQILGAGTVTLTASFPATEHYPAATKTQTITIGKKSLTVTAEDKSIQEGDPIPTLTVQYNGFVTGDGVVSLTTQPVASTTATSSSAPGQYNITVSGGVSDNYDFVYVAGTLTISQAATTPQTITFGALAAVTYGDADFAPGATSDNATIPIQYSSNNAGVATIVGGKVHVAGVGTTTITASQPGNGIYAPATPVAQTLTVGKATVTVTADDEMMVYGGAVPALTVSYSGFVNGEGVSVLATPARASTAATPVSAAGTYPITVGGAAAANYMFAYVAGTLTVTATTQTIVFGALPAKHYADGDFALTATSSNPTTPIIYVSSDPTIATITAGGLVHITGTGTAAITASQAASGNYAAAQPVSQTLTVGPSVLIISANDQTRVQGQLNPSFTFSYAGLKENETASDVILTPPVATTTANADSYPGIYPITISGAVSNNHYTVTYQTGTLTVVVDSAKTGGGDYLEAWTSSPTSVEVDVVALASQQAVIQLYSLYGQVVVSKEVYLVNADNHYTLPVAGLAPGLYVVKVTGQYLKLSQKIRIVR